MAFILGSCSSLEVNESYEDYTNQKEHITIFFGCSDTDLGIQDFITDKVSEEFPNVELEWETVGWGEYFAQQLDAKIASGELPDMIIGKAQDVSNYSKTGLLGEFDSSAYSEISDDFLDSTTVDGKLYGIPYNLFYQGVIYNKNIFWRYGLEPPKNFEELEQVVQKLNSVGVIAFASHFYDPWYTGNILMQFEMNEAFLNNDNWGNDIKSKNIDISTSSELKKSMDRVQYIYNHSWKESSEIGQNEAINRFIDEEAAMFVTGSWSVQDIYSIYPEMQLGIFPFPNEEGTQKLIYEPNLTFMKDAKSEHSETVDKIIQSIVSSEDIALDICAFTQTESTLKNVDTYEIEFISDEIQSYVDRNQIIDVNIGNSQIIWKFQLELAVEIKKWLDGEIDYSEVINFINENIGEDY